MCLLEASLDVIQEGMVCNFHMSHFIRLGSYPHCFILFTSIFVTLWKRNKHQGMQPKYARLMQKAIP